MPHLIGVSFQAGHRRQFLLGGGAAVEDGGGGRKRNNAFRLILYRGSQSRPVKWEAGKSGNEAGKGIFDILGRGYYLGTVRVSVNRSLLCLGTVVLLWKAGTALLRQGRTAPVLNSGKRA